MAPEEPNGESIVVRSWDLNELASSGAIYMGSATVSFCRPDGEVSGPAKVTIPPDGHVALEIEIQQHSIPQEYHGLLMPFLCGQVPEQIANGATEFRGDGNQEINGVEVATEYGAFRASRALVTRRHFEMFTNSGTSITVVPNDLVFVPQEPNPEEVWCVPVFGNLSELRGAETASSIIDHTPYVSFEADGFACGLEILTPSDETTGNECSGAIFGMIGNRPHNTADEVRSLLPSGLIAALNFATGSDINGPWMELRSFDGRLGRRVHIRIGRDRQQDGFPAFTQLDSLRPDSGVGPFLNRYFGLSTEARTTLTVPLNLVRSGTPGGATVDESITALVKALDAICKRQGIGRRNLSVLLGSQESADVQLILGEARRSLKTLRNYWKKDGKLGQLAILDRIISRQANVASQDLDFGLAVSDLLHKFNLFDAEAMNAYYSTLAQHVTWEGLLSTVRGEVIHSGAIHIRDSAALVSWFEFARHLHDICKRIILGEVGYTGTYAPSNVRYKGPYEVNRVKPQTSVQQLGYTLPPASI